MFGAKKLFVEATPFSETAVRGEFDIAGLETAIEPLRKACHWASEPRQPVKGASPLSRNRAGFAENQSILQPLIMDPRVHA